MSHAKLLILLLEYCFMYLKVSAPDSKIISCGFGVCEASSSTSPLSAEIRTFKGILRWHTYSVLGGVAMVQQLAV